jgi:hypothetical protein
MMMMMQGGFKLGFVNLWKKKSYILSILFARKGTSYMIYFYFSQFISKIPSHQLGKKLEKTNYFRKTLFAIMTNVK